MFMEKVATTNPASPFMGERYSVALLKELHKFQFNLVSYKHFAATRFFRHTLEEGFTHSRRTISCFLPAAFCLLLTALCFFRSQVRKQDYISNRMLVGQKHH